MYLATLMPIVAATLVSAVFCDYAHGAPRAPAVVSASTATVPINSSVAFSSLAATPHCYNPTSRQLTQCPPSILPFFRKCGEGYLCDGSVAATLPSSGSPSRNKYGVFEFDAGGVLGQVIVGGDFTYAQERILMTSPSYFQQSEQLTAQQISQLQAYCDSAPTLFPLDRVNTGCSLTRLNVSANVETGLYNLDTSFSNGDDVGSGQYRVEQLLLRKRDRDPDFSPSCSNPQPISAVVRPLEEFCRSTLSAARAGLAVATIESLRGEISKLEAAAASDIETLRADLTKADEAKERVRDRVDVLTDQLVEALEGAKELQADLGTCQLRLARSPAIMAASAEPEPGSSAPLADIVSDSSLEADTSSVVEQLQIIEAGLRDIAER